jgi:HEAT repeat protein
MNALMTYGPGQHTTIYDQFMHALTEREKEEVVREQRSAVMTLASVPAVKRAAAIFFNLVAPTKWEAMAESPTASWEMLEFLSNHSSPLVRSAVADNANTREETLVRLAHDQNEDVRFQLAENHNVPEEVLSILEEDENPYVMWRAETTRTRMNAQRGH